MEEKILIKGDKSNALMIVLAVISSLLSIAIFINAILNVVLNSVYSIVGVIVAIILIALVFTIFYVLPKLIWDKYELTVTNQRVFGKAAFGKCVDLPIDSISSIGTSFFKGIDAGTSSGKIRFKLMRNQAQIHSVLSRILAERQKIAQQLAAAPQSSVDELKKFKELLDSGVITPDEFEVMKKRLLNL